jgi:hypothetical protein
MAVEALETIAGMEPTDFVGHLPTATNVVEVARLTLQSLTTLHHREEGR